MKRLLILAIMVLTASSVFANQMNTGCGLGTMLLGKNSDTKLMQVLITSTNSTSTNQSTGITLDIEAFGCKRTEKWVVSEEMDSFVQGNMDNIIRDVAAGSGETIDSMAVILNVEDSELFAANLKANFSTIFPDENVEYTDVSEAIYSISLS